MRVKSFVVLMAAGALGLVAAEARAQDRWRVDLENGAAISGYNDVGIPGNTGTRFSMTDDLKSDTYFCACARLPARSETRAVGTDRAPDNQFVGHFQRPGRFRRRDLAPGVPTDGAWYFNSYR